MMTLKEKLKDDNIFDKLSALGCLEELNGEYDEILNKKLIADYGEKKLFYYDFTVDELAQLIAMNYKNKWSNEIDIIQNSLAPMLKYSDVTSYQGSKNISDDVITKVSAYNEIELTDNEQNIKTNTQDTNYTITSEKFNKYFYNDLDKYKKSLIFYKISDIILYDIDNLLNIAIWD